MGTDVKDLDAPVGALSGGQKQSVAICRSVMWANKVIFMDEPTAALGVRQTGKVLELVRRVADRGVAVVLISHNMPEVLEVADSIQVLRLGKRVAEYRRRRCHRRAARRRDDRRARCGIAAAGAR